MGVRPAKITSPRAAAAIPRPRLWARLDLVRKRGGALWVSGAPGSGKTTLVASWLQARRVRPVWLRIDAADEDLGTFLHYFAEAVRARCRCRVRLPSPGPGLDPEVLARRSFRAVLAHLPRGTVLVLDDVGELPDDGPVQRALRALVQELPRGTAAVLVSRGEPPPALAPARAAGDLAAVAPGELELNPAESWALARLHGFRGRRSESDRLHAATRGWAAGLVLLLEREGGPATSRPEATTADYFAGAFFDRADARTRRVLLEAALLDAPAASVAARATGDPAAPRILAGVARRGLFTLRHGDEDPAFEFHALFRAFLLRRGREELPPGRADEVRRSAAAALAERGGAEAEAAFALLADAGAFAEAAALAARVAPTLLERGRGATLEAWLARLPAEHRESDPWLLYFASVARLTREPESAREQLDRAAALFAGRGDAAGVWLSWASAVEAIVVAATDFNLLSRRLDDLAALRARFPVPSPEIDVRVTLAKLAALVFHAPGHPALLDAAETARAMALAPGDDRLRLAAGAWYHLHAGWWLGDFDGIRPVVRAVGPLARAAGADPLAATFWLATEAAYHLLAGDEAAAARTTDEARALVERVGVCTWDAVLSSQAVRAALLREDSGAARDAIAALRTRLRPDHPPADLSVLRVFESVVALRFGDPADAARMAAEAKELGERAGYPTAHVAADLALVRAHSARGSAHGAEAEAALASARRKIGALRSPPFEHILALAEADRARRAGRPDDAREALARAVPGARAGALHAGYFFSRVELGRLWALALRSGVAAEAVREIVRSAGLPAPPDAGAEWPWPTRIRALGRFEVERDGALLTGPGRSPRKPLELLRVLVALGGREVEEGDVADALWPDAEADAAQHALETTLYRLRRFVGADVVVQRERRLSIASDRCWVDAFELEARLAASRSGSGRRAGAEDAERIVALYRGPLLGDALDAPWAAGARERLRRRLSRWLDAVPGAGGATLRARLGAADLALAPPRSLRLA